MAATAAASHPAASPDVTGIHAEEAAMGGNSENPYAGQGPVLLDIGGDVGALVVVMPAPSEGLEVELRPSGATAAGAGTADDRGHSHTHGHSPADHTTTTTTTATTTATDQALQPAAARHTRTSRSWPDPTARGSSTRSSIPR